MTDSKEKLRQAKNGFYDSLQYNPANKTDLAEEYKNEIRNRMEHLREHLHILQHKKGERRNNKMMEAIMTELEQLDSEMEKLPLLVE
jgi:membrane-bound lytic murein transglycosylase MltF